MPSDRYAPVPNNSAFTDLNYALYLGTSAKSADLLIASVRQLPLSGRHTTVKVPATLLAFTDGLVERRGENIDIGLERLRDRASANHATLKQLITRLVDELRDGAAHDDTAIAGIRWVS